MIPYDFTCKVCGSHRFFTDFDDQLVGIRQCMDCQASAKVGEPQTIEIEPINRNEITSIGAIAASYLVGRKILLSGRIVHIQAVYPTFASRMALTILTDDGQSKRVYLPSRIELIPEGVE